MTGSPVCGIDNALAALLVIAAAFAPDFGAGCATDARFDPVSRADFVPENTSTTPAAEMAPKANFHISFMGVFPKFLQTMTPV
ncbi:hypothetical protein [Pseudomonas sp. CGJS7]|uniref:hypothetical protein n=1 Tax=Pseudomonas sp. CGJS7 TaxID=3109348 RepID=UPI0030097749